MMTVMRGAGTAGTLRATGLTDRGGGARGIRTAGIRLPGGAIGKRSRKDALQFRRLRGGQFAAGNFAGNQAVDLRLQIARRRTGTAA